MSMKIAEIQVFLVGARWRNFTMVKLTTDSGLVGWGEGTLGWKETAVREMTLDLGRRYVVGQSPFDIEALWFQIYQIEHNAGPVMFAAMAGIENAMWDLVGKACNQPVYNLVGGKVRSKVKAYANGWYSAGTDLGKLKDQAQDVVSRGYQALKFDPFGPGGREITRTELHDAAKRVEAVRKAVGDKADILLEFHGRFSPIMALEAARAMVPYAPAWCEEPVPANNNESMAQVVAALETARAHAGSPLIVIARTVKGKGLSFAEHNAAFHNGAMTAAQLAMALAEIDAALARIRGEV